MTSWKVHAQAYVPRTLGNERIPSARRLKAKAILWTALALLVPGGSVIALVAWLASRRR